MVKDDAAEKNRLLHVEKYLALNFAELHEFQNIVELAAKLCDKPVALITLLGDESNWLKVKFGTDIEVMPRETSFCKYAIDQEDILVISDATKDTRFVSNPLVHTDPNLRFYAGAPLKLSNGYNLGTLCLFDLKPNLLTDLQQQILTLLSRQVIFIMELEMGKLELLQQVEQTEARNVSLTKIAQLQAHQIRQPLTTIMGLVGLVKGDYTGVTEEWLTVFETAVGNFDAAIGSIVAESLASKDLRTLRFSRMVEEIDDYAILLLDENGIIENWNKGAQKIKGYKADEILGKNFEVFYSDEDLANDKPRKLIEVALELGVARDEGWRIRKGGDRFWGSIVLTAIYDDQRKVIGFTKVTRDLTDLILAQQAKIISSDMVELIAEHTEKLALVGGFEFDIVNNIITWTANTKKIHGVAADYVPELATALEFYDGKSNRNKISEALRSAIEEGKPWNLSLEIVTAQGERRQIQTLGRSNFKDGHCTIVYGTFGVRL